MSKCQQCGHDRLMIAGPYATWCEACGTFVREVAKSTSVPFRYKHVPETVAKLFTNIHNDELPRDLDRLEKLKFGCIENGMRVYWYYQEDFEYMQTWCHKGDAEEAIREQPPFSGLLVVMPDRDMASLEWDDVMLVVDRYPTEKCWPISEWISLGELLEQDNLVEVYTR